MWVLTVGDVSMSEEDMTAGEDEMAFTLAIQGGIPHQWGEHRPLHCPACMNAHAITMLASRAGFGATEAAEFVSAMERNELIGCLDPDYQPPAKPRAKRTAPKKG